MHFLWTPTCDSWSPTPTTIANSVLNRPHAMQTRWVSVAGASRTRRKVFRTMWIPFATWSNRSRLTKSTLSGLLFHLRSFECFINDSSEPGGRILEPVLTCSIFDSLFVSPCRAKEDLHVFRLFRHEVLSSIVLTKFASED